MPTDCPSEAELIAFGLGDLPEGKLDAVADHLERCPRCETRVNSLDSTDFVVSAVRRAASRPVPLPTGRVGEYEILSELGRGGMGVVYKARHERLRRIVALKVLLGGQFASAEHRARFCAEAELVARLQHPNIVQIFEAGEWSAPDGAVLPFLALEFVEGGTLARHADRPQPPTLAATWIETLARAVDSAHRQGVIHRDLKPSNVLIASDGQLKLCDFGVAKLQSGTDSRTMTGLLVGTPEYMAPEQAAGQAQSASPATDVWALGVILYSLLTGRPPFQAPDAAGVLQMLQHSTPVAPSQLQRGLPRDLETICLKCLRTEPRNRYASAGDLADDLRRFLDRRPIVARPTSTLEHAIKWARRHPGIAGLLTALLLVTTLGIMLVGWQWSEAVHQRGLADQRANSEASAKAKAEKNATREADARRDAERLLAGAVIDEALGACERGNVRLGLCRLAYGLERAVAASDPALEQTARLNLAAWRHQCLREVAVLPHTDWIWTVALSPDGKTALTVSKDGTAGLWEAATGRSLAVLKHPHPVFAGVFSPDGRIVLTGCGSVDGKRGETRLWDATTGAPLGAPIANNARVNLAIFRPDGKAFFTAAMAEGQLWDMATRQQIGVAMRHDGRDLLSAKFSPDGSRLMTGGGDGIPRLWNASTAESDGTALAPLKRPVVSVAWSPDGKTVVAGCTGNLAQVFDATTGKAGAPLAHLGVARELAFSSDGQLLAAGVVSIGGDANGQPMLVGEVRVWRTSNWELLYPALRQPKPIWSVAFSPSGRRLLSGSEDGMARLFDSATGSEVGHPMTHDANVRAVCFGPDGRTALTACAGGAGRAKIWELPPEREIPLPLQHSQPVCGVTFANDPDSLTTCCTDGALRRWPLKSGTPTDARLEGQPTLVRACFDSSGLAVSGVTKTFGLRAWDVKTARQLWESPMREARPLYAFSPDGTRFPEETAAGVTWRTKSGSADGPALRHPSPPRLAVLSPDGRVALTSGGMQVRVWELPSGQQLGGWDVPHEISAAAFGPDGQTAALGDTEGAIQLWDFRASRSVGPRMSHRRAEILEVAYSADGRLLGTAGGDETARLWDTATGRQIGPAMPHRGAVATVAFHPRNEFLACGVIDRTAQLWPLPQAMGGVVEEVHRVVGSMTRMSWDSLGRARDLPVEELRRIRSP